LNKGADGAHGEDTCGLKSAVVGWLMCGQPTPEPALEPRCKFGRGFYHDATAQLLCPVEHNWSNPQAYIRNQHPDYLVTADCWPYFLYEDEHYDSDDPMKGLFKNILLVTAFKHMFTSPSSADFVTVPHDNEPQASTSAPPLKRQRGPSDKSTRSHVATIIGMKSVAPRVIAYTAVQLRLALSSCPNWRVVDDHFNFQHFYHHIVAFFEECSDTEADRAEIDELLLWWN
ncbi:hypothetical protein SCLCIDRAFT_92329, partial [Scleroderma citrinum Foug A]